MNNQDGVRPDITRSTEEKCAKELCCGIYGLKNRHNDKWYIGQSKNVEKRFSSYKSCNCKNQKKLYRALMKYGPESFDMVVLEECSPVDWILDYREMFWIRLMRTINDGYNLKEGGSRGSHSEESKDKMRRSHIGKRCPRTKEHQMKIANANRGKKRSYQQILNIKNSLNRKKIGSGIIFIDSPTISV